MQAHLISGVVMDIAAFKVSHPVGSEIDATALRAARARSSSIGAMEESSRRAYPVSVISEHVGVGQRRRAFDVKSPALPTMSTRNVPAGRWMKVQGKFKLQAHISSGVIMDIAAFKVRHSIGIDIDATAPLRAARVRSNSIGALFEKVQCYHVTAYWALRAPPLYVAAPVMFSPISSALPAVET
eukprot:scaffold36779_cov71-Phaeocystis_antarctica.AAC.2